VSPAARRACSVRVSNSVLLVNHALYVILYQKNTSVLQFLSFFCIFGSDSMASTHHLVNLENHHHWWPTEKCITMTEIDQNTSQNITELSVFDFLPSWVKMRLDPFPPGHKDWKACSSCGVYDRNSKLMACSQCRNSRLGPIYYCVSTISEA
jgi:hypothetical protein